MSCSIFTLNEFPRYVLGYLGSLNCWKCQAGPHPPPPFNLPWSSAKLPFFFLQMYYFISLSLFFFSTPRRTQRGEAFCDIFVTYRWGTKVIHVGDKHIVAFGSVDLGIDQNSYYFSPGGRSSLAPKVAIRLQNADDMVIKRNGICHTHAPYYPVLSPHTCESWTSGKKKLSPLDDVSTVIFSTVNALLTLQYRMAFKTSRS